MSETKTVAGAYQKIESHEQLCAERYANIHAAIGDIKGLLKWSMGWLATLAVGVIGYLLTHVVG